MTWRTGEARDKLEIMFKDIKYECQGVIQVEWPVLSWCFHATLESSHVNHFEGINKVILKIVSLKDKPKLAVGEVTALKLQLSG